MDDFFVGAWASQRVDVKVKARSGGTYTTHCASDLEDTPVNQAARRLGYSPEAGDLLFVRSASDIEEEPLLPMLRTTDQMIAFLRRPDRFPDGFPGVVPAFNNGYLVAATIAHYLLDHPNAVP